MSFRKSSLNDFQQIMKIINGAKEWQKSKGREQWPSFYPSPELVETDIKNGNCYVLEAEAKTIGTFCFWPKGHQHFSNLL